MSIHNKLVRDLILNIIEETGKNFSTKVLGHEEYIKELRKKSQEELQEYLEAKDDESAIQELADLLEIIHALSKCHGADMEKVEEVRVKKMAKCGGFEDKIFLIKVED